MFVCSHHVSLPPVPMEGKHWCPLKASQWGHACMDLEGPWLHGAVQLGAASRVPEAPILVTPWPFSFQWRNQSRISP